MGDSEYKDIKPIYLSVKNCDQEARSRLLCDMLKELEKSKEALEEGRKRAEQAYERDCLGIRGQAI